MLTALLATLTCIVVAACLLLLWVVYKAMYEQNKKLMEQMYRPEMPPPSAPDEKLQKVLEKMLSRMDEQEQREMEAFMVEYAARKRQKAPQDMMVGGKGDERIHTKNPAGKDILIPEGLSEVERAILKDFYDL